MHLHLNRGKRSVVLDLRTEAGVETFLALVAQADAVVEAMRPGGLARRGLGFDRLREVNPRIVMCTISGYGMTGPYRDLPSHGIAYDSWAGVFKPDITADGFPAIPEHVSIGINVGPLYGAIAILAGIVEGARDRRGRVPRDRAVGRGRGHRLAAHRDRCARTSDPRARSPATSPTTTSAARPAPRAWPRASATRSTRASDGYVMLMCSEQEFWKNFCNAAGRPDLFERWPGSRYADHARGNVELRAELRDVFRTRTSAEWLELSGSANFPLAPVNDSGDGRARPAVHRPARLDPDRPARRRRAADPDQARRRRAGAAREGARARAAHRRGARRRARLRRRPHRRIAEGGRVRPLSRGAFSPASRTAPCQTERACDRVTEQGFGGAHTPTRGRSAPSPPGRSSSRLPR